MKNTWWIDNEGKIKRQATHTIWYKKDPWTLRLWDPDRPFRGRFVYFIDHEGELIYIGIIRDPGRRFIDRHAVQGELRDIKASSVPPGISRKSWGFTIPALEVGESLFIVKARSGMNVNLKY